MTPNFLLLVTVTLIGLGAIIIELIRRLNVISGESRTYFKLVEIYKQRGIRYLDSNQLRKKIGKIGLRYAPEGYCLIASNRLMKVVRAYNLQYELGVATGLLMQDHDPNTDPGKTFWIINALAHDSGRPKWFLKGIREINPDFYAWHRANLDEWLRKQSA